MKLTRNQKTILRLSEDLGSQAEAARALGLSQASISRIIGGRQEPSGPAVLLAQRILISRGGGM